MSRTSSVGTLSIFLFAVMLFMPFRTIAQPKKEKAMATKTGAVLTVANIDSLNAIIKNAGNRLLMFDLYADWCMPCRILSPMLETIAKEQKSKISIYKVNVDKNPQIAGAFGVSGIPYVVFVKNQKAVYALTGVQSKDTYLRAIERFAAEDPAEDITPDGELVEGVRIIRLQAGSNPGSIYVYRGETVSLQIENVAFPYSIAIPDFNITGEGVIGKPLKVSFKAKETGVYPIFCNGKCPAGDGAQYGRIVVMQYKSTGNATFAELTPKEAAALIAEKKPLILDVRTPNEYYSGHLEGAKLIPLQQLDARISELNAYKDKDILVYCRSGNRSTVASQILIKKGFSKLHNLRPGIRGWEAAGNKITTK
jgi:thioredoxin